MRSGSDVTGFIQLYLGGTTVLTVPPDTHYQFRISADQSVIPRLEAQGWRSREGGHLDKMCDVRSMVEEVLNLDAAGFTVEGISIVGPLGSTYRIQVTRENGALIDHYLIQAYYLEIEAYTNISLSAAMATLRSTRAVAR